MPPTRWSAWSPGGHLAMAVALCLVLNGALPCLAYAQQGGQWVQQGPLGAPVNTVVVHPTNPSIVYIGLDLRGVYRSDNGGNSWTAVNDGLTDLNVQVLAISPSDPSILFAVTALGVFRTSDSGTTWHSTSGGAAIGGSVIAIHPDDPGTVYLTGGRGIYRTTDAGQTWALVTTGLTEGDNERIQCLGIDPVTPTTVYACGRARFFRSTNGGDQWQRIDVSGFFRGQMMVVDPVTPTTLYHASLEMTFGGVHRSLDGGATWTRLLDTPVTSMALDPVSPSTIYACTFFRSFYKSTNGGVDWNSANVGLSPGGCGGMVVHPLVPTTLFAVAGTGVVRSDNAAASWTPVNSGLTYLPIYNLVTDPSTPSRVYSTRGWLLGSPDMGASWNHLGLSVDAAVVHPQNPSILYSALRWDVFRTLDGGLTWTLPTTGVPYATYVSALAIDPLLPSTVYAVTSGGIYRSADGGDNWGLLSSAPAPTGPLVIDPMTSIVYVAAGPSFSSVFRSVDRGDTWTAVNAGLPTDVHVRALAIASANPSVLYLSTHAHGVFRTTNGGGTWVPANAGLPPNTVLSLAIDPADASTVYAATPRYHDGLEYRPGTGVFRTTNGGVTWTAMNAGLTDLDVNTLAIEPRSPTVLYAGTTSSSVFRWQPDGVRRLAVVSRGSGTGTVTSAPAGIVCGADCVEELAIGSVVTLTQNAIPPSTFVAFGGDADCLDGVVTLTDNRTCTATFNLPAHVLTIARSGAGTGTVTSAPPGINCGADCDESYWLGTIVTLTAAPAAGSVFAGWSGDCAGSTPTCQVTITQARTVTATFNPDVPVAFFKVFPLNASAGQSASAVSLAWLAAARAETYEACYDAIDNNLCDGAWTSVSTTFRVISGLSRSTTYYWQVRARNLTGTTEADAGAWWRFTTSAAGAPSTQDDAFAATIGTALVVPAPGVLGNDLDNGGGVLSAVLMTAATSGVVVLNAAGGFTYTPAAGFAGVATFTYRAVNSQGSGNAATVTITVHAVTTAQPPGGLSAWSMAGNRVTLRWTPPALGPTPTGYVVEGGIAPGEVLASLSTGSASPIFSVALPRGAFYVRVHALAGASRSAASNEIRIFVDVPVPPSAPQNLLGAVNGSSLTLEWQNTFAGGAPTSLVLDVTGSAAASISLGLVERFSYSGVPAGTYSLAVRAVNGAGSSAGSNAISLGFPGACSGAPQLPRNFLAFAIGNTIAAVWDPPPTGSPATTGYVVNATGALTGSFPLTGRMPSAPVGPGSYGLSVTAITPCGASAATPVQSVTIP